jgi:hypothetical protein
MPKNHISFEKPNNEIRSKGKIVGLTDEIYNLTGPTIIFPDVLVKGDLSGELEYNGKKIKVVRIDTVIGLEASLQGARGPVWKGVECEVIE